MTYHAASENGISHPAKYTDEMRCFGKQNYSGIKIMATKHCHFAAKIKLGLSLRVKTSKNWMMGGCLGLGHQITSNCKW